MECGLCLKVKKGYGELARRRLLALGLLDRGRRISVEGEYVYLPIVRRLDPAEVVSVSEVGDISVEAASLPEVKKTQPRSLREALSGKVPKHVLSAIPRSYDLVGDIVLIERLSPGTEEFRRDIAEALLKIHKSAKTVLLKVGKVSGPYRVPVLEHLAGEERTVTIHSEHGIRMKVDLSKTYFSPRLGFERKRIASEVRDGETVVDMFSGVGPFSLMIAKKSSATVYAIDINPDAIALLEENIRLNRLKGKIVPICADAREASSRLPHVADRVIMNLPAQALDFVGTACTFLKRDGGKIHLYTFAGPPPIDTAIQNFHQATSHLQGRFEVVGSRVVKATAPRQWIVSLQIEFRPA